MSVVDAMMVHAVVDQPEYERGNILLVCEDPGDAAAYVQEMKDPDVIVVPVPFVPAGQRHLVQRRLVHQMTVTMERDMHGQWKPRPVYARQHSEWLLADPPVDVAVESIGRTAISQREKWVVRATGPTVDTTNAALQEKLRVLLEQLEAGKLT